jgi:hypothetical protein
VLSYSSACAREALVSATDGLRVACNTGQNLQVVALQACLAYIAALAGGGERCNSLVGEIHGSGEELVSAWGSAALYVLVPRIWQVRVGPAAI